MNIERGFLLYSTCTVNKIENAEVVSKFLRKHKELNWLKQTAFTWGRRN